MFDIPSPSEVADAWYFSRTVRDVMPHPGQVPGAKLQIVVV